MLACKTHLHHPYLTMLSIGSQDCKAAAHGDLKKSREYCHGMMLIVCATGQDQVPELLDEDELRNPSADPTRLASKIPSNGSRLDLRVLCDKRFCQCCILGV